MAGIFRKIPEIIALALIAGLSVNLKAQQAKVPGIVITHEPASMGRYIGSPSVCILTNGDYVASHDYFGPSSNEHERAATAVYRSADRGKTWTRISEIDGQFWSNLFFHKGQLYIMGTFKHHGSLIIRRSDDGGKSWSAPDGSDSGLLLEGEYHTAPVPVIIHNGRIWRAIENARSPTEKWGVRYSAMVISAPVDADLLNASAWKTSNFLTHDPAYLSGQFGGWLEGNVVVTPDGDIVDFLRVATSEPGRDMAAVVRISDDGSTASFDQSAGFIDFAGGARKFTIRYDSISGRYWTITNMIKEEFKDLPAGSVRNTLVLQSSPDLRGWSGHKILISHPDVIKHGFQYVDWQFDGKDIIFVCRTAFDDQYGGGNNYHDANYMTFHRIKKFRKLERLTVK